MDGILLVDKPSDWTSHDVVAKIRRELSKTAGHKIKVGHTGTLDPMATGLLILVIGSYTKCAQEFSKLDKTYDTELTLGHTSTTGDAEGEITAVSNQRPVGREIEQTLKTFVGEIEQTPPAYSAIKVDGQRAYKLARQGKEVVIEPRKITIYDIKELKYSYPKLSFTATVSSGTYIRSLAADIGDKLGTGAYLSDLRRTEVGQYKITDAKTIDKITKFDIISS